MNNLPGVTVLAESTKEVTQAINGHISFTSVGLIIIILGISLLAGYACAELECNGYRTLSKIIYIITPIILIIGVLGVMYTCYDHVQFEQTTYVVKLDETAPYLPLTNDYEFVGEENGLYTFRTKYSEE